MRTALALSVVLVPALAFAQAPGDPQGAQPLPPPAPPPTGSPAVQPYQPQPYQPQPAGPTGPWATHQGITFEANLGVGFAHLTDSNSNSSINTDAALAGLDIGVGGWLNPQLALTGRISGVDIKYGDSQTGTASIMGTLVLAWVGPSLQYWPDPHFWMGGGVGFATYRLIGNNSCSASTQSDACGINGFGFDMRAGYTFGDSQHTFNTSIEINPSHFSDNNSNNSSGGGWGTAIAFLVGYQYL